MKSDNTSNKPVVAEPEHPFRHTMEAQIRFNDIDVLGHVNNSIYLQLADLAKMKYFMAVLGDRFDPRQVGLVIANINCDFVAPAYIEENLQMLTRTLSISHKSLIIEQRLINRDTAEVKCVARTVMVSYDPVARRSTPVSDMARHAIEAYEGCQFPAPAD